MRGGTQRLFQEGARLLAVEMVPVAVAEMVARLGVPMQSPTSLPPDPQSGLAPVVFVRGSVQCDAQRVWLTSAQASVDGRATVVQGDVFYPLTG